MNPDSQLPRTARVAPPAHAELDALPAGTRFGEFEILGVLGAGGFGIVYLAHDHSLERQVALKEYMPAALATRGAGAQITVRAGAFAQTYAMGLRSFVNEARLLARFDHPSLVKVYRFWEDNATAYTVMPYLQGMTLRTARLRMAQPPGEAWLRGVLDPVLDAVELLHAEGVFHRDIAPDNIVLPPGAAPILLDFGAARRVIGDRAQSLTAILKPSYAPIEQYAEAETMRQGPWTDLYALGAVMYFLLFGVPPPPATVRAVQDDAEPIESRVVPGVSPRFMGAVAWMLGVRPVHRPQSVAELRAVLKGAREIAAPFPPGLRIDVTVPDFAAWRAATTGTSVPVATDGDPSAAPAARAASDRAPLPRAGVGFATTQPMVVPARDGEEHRATVTQGRAAPASAPLRSTPPGAPPPVHVPDARAASVPPPAGAGPLSVVAADRASGAVRRRAAFAGVIAALVLGAAGVATLRPAAPGGVEPPLAGVTLPGGAGQLPAVAAAAAGLVRAPDHPDEDRVPRRASPPSPHGADAMPVVLGTALPVDGASAGMAQAPAALAGVRLTDAPAGRGTKAAPAAQGARPRATVTRTAARPAPQRAATQRGPAGHVTARHACGERRFVALALCMERECERLQFSKAADCVRVLDLKRQRVERRAAI